MAYTSQGIFLGHMRIVLQYCVSPIVFFFIQQYFSVTSYFINFQSNHISMCFFLLCLFSMPFFLFFFKCISSHMQFIDTTFAADHISSRMLYNHIILFLLCLLWNLLLARITGILLTVLMQPGCPTNSVSSCTSFS